MMALPPPMARGEADKETCPPLVGNNAYLLSLLQQSGL